MSLERAPVIPASSDAYILAEGPRWDAARRRVLWVDIKAGSVFEGELNDDSTIAVTRRHDFDTMVGAVAFAADGTLLVAAQEALIVIAPDGSRRELLRVIPKGSGRRTNDGGVDPVGRFLIGTLSLAGGSAQEELLRIERDCTLTILDRDLTLSNGLAWSVDGRSMYTVDTMRRIVYVRDYPACSERRVHLEIDHGYPDGITVDVEDHLWVALWGIGAVHRYSPEGVLVQQISVPAPHTSSVTFAGTDLRTLVITTASDQLSDTQRVEHPDSGRLFTSRTEVAGLASTPWEEI